MEHFVSFLYTGNVVLRDENERKELIDMLLALRVKVPQSTTQLLEQQLKPLKPVTEEEAETRESASSSSVESIEVGFP